MERPSPDAELLSDLRDLLHEAFTDGLLNVDILRETLGELAETGADDSHYGLHWPGKTAARRQAARAPSGALHPAPGSAGPDATGNVLVRGDNLEVLRILTRAYTSRVGVVYIDPPYNTGQDMLYKDDFSDPVSAYLEATGQADFAGLLTANPKTSGRFHSRWLSEMYPRLRLAKQALRDGGVIFVSIDDNEVQNLRLVMDEIFGEENHVETFCWVRTATPAALATKSKKTVEYILCYENIRSSRAYQGVEKPVQSSNPLLNQPNRVSTLTFPADAVTTGIADGVVEPGTYGTAKYEVTVLERAEVRGGRFITPLTMSARFRWSQPYLADQLAKGVRVHIATAKMIPSYEKDSYGREAPPNLIDKRVGVGTNEDATSELRALLPKISDEALSRMHPKPVSLISYLIDAVAEPDDLVMDFFAGSGTTGEAVLRLNRERGTRRKFIIVQLPEPVAPPNDAPYPTIADITQARLTAVCASLAQGASPGEDVGFRVLAQGASNVQRWVPYEGDDDLALVALMRRQNGLASGWTPEGLLIEVMLLEGYPLDSTRSQHTDFLDNVVTCVEHPSIPVRLLVCLDDVVADTTVEALTSHRDDLFVCRERALTDVMKVRIADVIHRVKTL